MNLLNTLLLTIILALPAMALSQDTCDCRDKLTIELGPGDTYALFPEDIWTCDLEGYTVLTSDTLFDCADIGIPVFISSELYKEGVLVGSPCMTQVVVHESAAPIARCKPDLSVDLDAEGNYVFTFADIDDGSWDNCTISEYAIFPESIDCTSPNPVSVALTVRDLSGNTSTCTTFVHWSPFPNAEPSYDCRDTLQVSLGVGQVRRLTASELLIDGPDGCPNRFTLMIQAEGDPDFRPEPVVTLQDTNKTIVGMVLDHFAQQAVCFPIIDVVFPPECSKPFSICDTECRSSPVSDCDGGHSMTDMVEWPCSPLITGDCDSYLFSLIPEELIAAGVDPADAMPTIINAHCYLAETSYADQEVVFPETELKITARRWTITYLPTGEAWTYDQYLRTSVDVYEICDILPWNSPAGDCGSGHSLEDAVEWPADITVSGLFNTPDDLSRDPSVAVEDTRPRLVDPCGQFEVEYADEVYALDEFTAIVERTWRVNNPYIEREWTYTQRITSIDDTRSSEVFTSLESGASIPDVTLVSGILTDSNGHYVFPDPEGIVVVPEKDDPLEAGVNILDQVLLQQDLYGGLPLTPFQRIAADMDEDGQLTVGDSLALEQVKDGVFVPAFPRSWKFFDERTQEPAADISNPMAPYRFIGVKMGDIDNSFLLLRNGELERIRLEVEDEILNKGERYEIPMSFGENLRIIAFTMAFAWDPAFLEIDTVKSFRLPGFSEEKHVKRANGQIIIEYIAPREYWPTGVRMPAFDIALIFGLHAKRDSILNDVLGLADSWDNLLLEAGHRAPVAPVLDWNGVIISSVITAGNSRQLSFYPNPVTDRIRFTGLDAGDVGRIQVVDVMGRAVFRDVLRETVDLSGLMTGTYYLTVEFADGSRGSGVMYKM